MNRDAMVQFYIEQYERSCQKKQKNARRPSGYEERLNRLIRTMKRGKGQRMSSALLEEYHRQARNLAYFAFRSQNKNHIRRIEEELLPELFRLDLGLLMPQEQEQLSEAFLSYARESLPLQITVKPLF